jgi:hypothetical protein
MAGDPQTFALAALFSFQGANKKRANREQFPTALGRGRSGHDGYHIAADMACQGM